MARLHLRPVPSAEILPFPNSAAFDPESVIAQLSNLQTIMAARHGPYLARGFFVEAAAAVIARSADDVGGNAVEETRKDMLACFDQAIDERMLLQPGFPIGGGHL